MKVAAVVRRKERKHSNALKVNQISTRESTLEALLDSCATTDLLSKRLAKGQAVTFEKDSKRTIPANGVSCVVSGVAGQVRI